MNKKKKTVLFLCTGNSCRSQIAEGLLKNISEYTVYSAGIHPSRVHPLAIKVMKEIEIDITNQSSDPIDKYFYKDIDFIITVCDKAKESCPIFPGNGKHLHWSIEDPFKNWSLDNNQIESFRKTRESIKTKIAEFLNSY